MSPRIVLWGHVLRGIISTIEPSRTNRTEHRAAGPGLLCFDPMPRRRALTLPYVLIPPGFVRSPAGPFSFAAPPAPKASSADVCKTGGTSVYWAEIVTSVIGRCSYRGTEPDNLIFEDSVIFKRWNHSETPFADPHPLVKVRRLAYPCSLRGDRAVVCLL